MDKRVVTLGTFRPTTLMRAYVNQVLDSGQISYGHYSKRLETEFAKLHNCNYGILSSSGTSSLLIALQTLKEIHGWGDGHEVILPATTFVATANIVLQARMEPIFVDVNPFTYNIDIEEVAKNIHNAVRVIIPVHMFGQPADMQELKKIIHGEIKIIEDSCETMFATHMGLPVGSWGDIGCFSMYAAHLLVAGVGGIATTNDPGYAVTMRSLANHGLSPKQLNMDENFSPMPAVGRRFEFDSIGHSSRITEFETAVALAQLENWEEMIRKRRENAAHLTARLEDIRELILPFVHPANTHSWMMYPIILDKNIRGITRSKNSIVKYLNNNGVQTRDMPSLLYQPAYKDIIHPEDYPVSDWIAQSGFYVGCHQDLTIDDMDYVADKIITFVKEGRYDA